jgi:hypothetical protein
MRSLVLLRIDGHFAAELSDSNCIRLRAHDDFAGAAHADFGGATVSEIGEEDGAGPGLDSNFRHDVALAVMRGHAVRASLREDVPRDNSTLGGITRRRDDQVGFRVCGHIR